MDECGYIVLREMFYELKKMRMFVFALNLSRKKFLFKL